jgi:acetylornithine deacetylase/succinyl-diaminopimelate desuccinylase-like protein
MEVDMRSSDKASLEALHEKFKIALREAVDEENKRWPGRGTVSVSPELVGIRPPGETPANSPIVTTTAAVSKLFGFDGRLGEGSTDSNVPMGLNIPAVTIGGGGRGTGAHSLNEAFDTTDSMRGTQRALVLAIALAR